MIFRYVLPALLLSSSNLFAGAIPTDSVRPVRGVARLTPHHLKAQFAGSIGWLSVGTGYRFWKQKADADVFVGYVPPRYNGATRALYTASLKGTYWFWKVPLTAHTTVYPLSFGLWGSITPGDNLELIWPDYYPHRYYWAPTGVRVGGFIGGRLERTVGSSDRARSVAAYYELGTNDLLAASWFHNRRTVSVGSLLHLALGVQVRLR